MASILKRGKRWRALIRKRGVTRCNTFDTKSAAKAWATRIEAQLDLSFAGGHKSLGGATVADLLDRYVREIKPLKPWRRSKDFSLDVIRRDIGGMPAVYLNSVDTHLTFAARRRAAGSGPETIGQYLSYLHALMKVARHVWRLDIDPAAVAEARSALSMVNAVAKGNTRHRRPTAEELERLFTYWGGRNDLYLPMVDITRFAVASAMRLGEIVSLRWDDLDHDDRTVLIRDRKHPTEKLGNDQIVPMFTEAWQIAMRQPQTRERIFPYGRQRISDNWRRSTRACGIKDLRFHDLRHEGTSRLFEAGYQIHEVAIVTGHRDWSSLKRYTQIHARDLHRD